MSAATHTFKLSRLLGRNKGKQKEESGDQEARERLAGDAQAKGVVLLSRVDDVGLGHEPRLVLEGGSLAPATSAAAPRRSADISLFEQRQQNRWIGPEAASEDQYDLPGAFPRSYTSTPPLSPSGPSSSSPSLVSPASSELTFALPQPPATPTPPSPLAIDPDAPPVFSPFELRTRELLRTAVEQLIKAHDDEVSEIKAPRRPPARARRPTLTIRIDSDPPVDPSPTSPSAEPTSPNSVTPRPATPRQPDPTSNPASFYEQSHATTGELLWLLRQHLDSEVQAVRLEETAARNAEVYGVRLELAGENERRRNADGWRRWAEREKQNALNELAALRYTHADALRRLEAERTAHEETRISHTRRTEAVDMEREASRQSLAVAEATIGRLNPKVAELETAMADLSDQNGILRLQKADIAKDLQTAKIATQTVQFRVRDLTTQLETAKTTIDTTKGLLELEKVLHEQVRFGSSSRATQDAAVKAALTRDVGSLRLQLAETLENIVNGASGRAAGSIDWDRGEGKMIKEALSDALGCPLCLDLAERPATLPCGHSGCVECLQECLEEDRRCPICRTEVSRRWDAKRCFALEGAVDVVKKLE